ncbi:hypothetical protein Cgig2_011172 [Carnegiea gigantea]|uniref:Reverse transcriptase n=1 Tax=Carnegiea gigantea TaxID=171969 RepID=A0A9Q1JK30_9CARY|nr:hypothetical protein Cgig2_011172 [Carnegiea gigantea]
MNVASYLGKYLGVPVTFETSKVQEFNFLIEKVRRKLQAWKTKFLSPVGRLLLINNVIGTLCQHTQSVYQAPTSTLRKITSLVMGFFWSNSQGTMSTTMSPRRIGDAGSNKMETCIVNASSMNNPLKTTFLIAQLYRGKYSTHSPIDTAYYDCKEQNALRGHRPVPDLLNTSNTAWDLRKLAYLFPCNVAWNILLYQIRPTQKHHRLYLPLSLNGEYNVKSEYKWLTCNNKLDSNHKTSKV